ncbi:50S ribosomal protein L4 [Pyronema omphalodes]|nr:50S ribosomal protein L4 [Pyronema omphalodes]
MSLRPTTLVRALPARSFSSSARAQLPGRITRRITRDRNPNRGISPVNRKPHADKPMLAEKYGLPKPVSADKLTKVETDPDHGLWGFFREHRNALSTPEQEFSHGRSWAVEELRGKSWDDLHKLWWACVKERNIIATQFQEHQRMKPGYGDHELQERDNVVKVTMRGIKHVLTERYYAWEEAKVLSKDDPEINLSGQGPLYSPKSAFEDAPEVEKPALAAEQKA